MGPPSWGHGSGGGEPGEGGSEESSPEATLGRGVRGVVLPEVTQNCDDRLMTESASATEKFRAARDLLLRHRDDYDAGRREFAWPELDEFNWALDWFDVIAAEHPDRTGLRIVADDGDTSLTYAELANRSGQVANWLRGLGVRRGDRVLLMLGNVAPLWEVILAMMKLGAVIIPASTLLQPTDLTDRIARGGVRHVITDTSQVPKFHEVPGDWTRVAVEAETPDPAGFADASAGWHAYADSYTATAGFTPDGVTHASDPLLLYFTSGTTAQPKLVAHTHVSYPVGHLSTMYWIGIQPGDVHLNLSSPGWAKHAWSNVFAPWNAGATILVLNYQRFSAPALLSALGDCRVSTFCAPPTVWRMIIQSDLTTANVSALRECVAAGEPLNPEVIEQIRKAWSITVRDGFGQTETTAQVGNTPGQPVRPGSMGRPLPGYQVTLVDPVSGKPARDGEICLDLSRRPLGLMTAYLDDPALNAEAMRDGYYHTGDVATSDEDGYITYVGRTDDVFKASDYRISPFELESVLIEHEAVAEAAVVPSPDPVRLAVPKAYILLTASSEPSPELARSIMAFCRERVAPYKRIRRIEFADLPKTISGKIRRVELRGQETSRVELRDRASRQESVRGVTEFWEEDFSW
jgi:acetyl-CoA synthetase